MNETNGFTFDRRAAEMREFVHNELLSRAGAFQKLLGCKKDIEGECGHPETIVAEEFRRSFDRDPVGRRVVELMPNESWQVQPTVREDDNPDNQTDFERVWDDLDNNLRGGSLYQNEQGSIVWDYLRRLDVMSGIGHYGVLLLGFDDGADLREPVEPNANRELLFLRVFDESLAEIARYETDEADVRFGQPSEYTLHFNDTFAETVTSFGMPLTTRQVHWSRVIHVADNLVSSEIFGTPRQRQVWNRLCDLRKLYGGSAEMYWKGAFPGLSIESHPQMGGDVEFDPDAMRGQMDDYYSELKRYLALSGFSAKSLAPQVVDPSPQIERQLEAISLTLGVPMQILIGALVGELRAATEARVQWHAKIAARQTGHITPRIIVPFVDRLIATGVLPTPSGYSVQWPHMASLSAVEESEIAAKRMQAAMQYVQSGADALVPPMEFLTRIWGLEDEEAEAVIEAAVAEQNDPLIPEPEPVMPEEGGDPEQGQPFQRNVDSCGAGSPGGRGFEPGNTCARGGGGLSLKVSKKRAWNGEAVKLNNKLSKLDTGEVGEQIGIAWLNREGFPDADTLNVDVNNFPVDLIHNHEVIEVKAGLASNSKSAQQWRATIGQPGKEERAWLKTISREEKAAWNAQKAQAIMDRKQSVVDSFSKKFKKPVKGKTLSVIINPDTKTADVYLFGGFHHRVGWKSQQAQDAYQGSYKYE